MEIETAFKNYLLAYAGLTALIGDRFYDELPQNATYPAVTYLKVSDNKDHLLAGISEVESPFFQFTAHAMTKVAARNVMNQIRAALCDYVGTMSGIVIQHIRLENDIGTLETSPDGIVKVQTESHEYQITFEKE